MSASACVVGFPFFDSFVRKKVANSCVMPWPIPVMSSSNTWSLFLLSFLPHSSCSFLARNARLPLANRIQHTTKHTHTQSSRYPPLHCVCVAFHDKTHKRGKIVRVSFFFFSFLLRIYCVNVAPPSRLLSSNFIFDFLPVSVSSFHDDPKNEEAKQNQPKSSKFHRDKKEEKKNRKRCVLFYLNFFFCTYKLQKDEKKAQKTPDGI